VTETGPALTDRYGPGDLDVLEPEARIRYLTATSSENADPLVAWELLYRKEPELYDRLVRGERIHPDVLDALPRAQRCVEVGAGTGRLTTHLSQTCARVVAIEPAAPLRAILEERAASNVEVRSGYFDDTGLDDASADLVVSCSAFTADPAHGGDPGLDELDRIAAPGATIAFVWPSDVAWLEERGFTYRSFPGDLAVDFGTLEEAVDLARIFYPDAVDAIVERGEPSVPFELLGMNPPRDIAWRVK
jgi:SAM-dependent methyltransferase